MIYFAGESALPQWNPLHGGGCCPKRDPLFSYPCGCSRLVSRSSFRPFSDNVHVSCSRAHTTTNCVPVTFRLFVFRAGESAMLQRDTRHRVRPVRRSEARRHHAGLQRPAIRHSRRGHRHSTTDDCEFPAERKMLNILVLRFSCSSFEKIFPEKRGCSYTRMDYFTIPKHMCSADDAKSSGDSSTGLSDKRLTSYLTKLSYITKAHATVRGSRIFSEADHLRVSPPHPKT